MIFCDIAHEMAWHCCILARYCHDIAMMFARCFHDLSTILHDTPRYSTIHIRISFPNSASPLPIARTLCTTFRRSCSESARSPFRVASKQFSIKFNRYADLTTIIISAIRRVSDAGDELRILISNNSNNSNF